VAQAIPPFNILYRSLINWRLQTLPPIPNNVQHWVTLLNDERYKEIAEAIVCEDKQPQAFHRGLAGEGSVLFKE